ncbi:glycosyltransferase family 2 protein [Phocaeicola sartorii]|uniref:glycosyltransferase family 2 protein n=1 Tax=Phocaeicola sartorii TaxID=671267 RepID=UPI001F563787|nr:glycosyltransferase family 2 protein [Phocaeicola sartorii]
MKDQPLVSICVPVYNVGQYIERCCRSLFEQSYNNIEYIFVDDCSSDESIDIVRQTVLDYPERTSSVEIIKHKENKGSSGARNSGIDVSSGYFLLFVDGDDYIDSQTVELLVKQAMRDDVDVVIYDSKFIYANRIVIPNRTVPSNKEDVVKYLLTYKLAPSVCGKLYKTSLVKDHEIRFIEGLNVGEDYCTSPCILYYANKVSHCKGCYYNYIKYNETSYTNNYKAKSIEDMIRAVSILDVFFKSKDDYQIYEDCLQEAHLRVKVNLLLNICRYRSSVWNLIPMVASLYQNMKQANSVLPRKYKFVLWLSEHKFYNILYVYVNIGIYLKELFAKVHG